MDTPEDIPQNPTASQDSVGKQLTPQQRGAMITNSGKSPIAGLPVEQRNALIQSVLTRYLADETIAEIAQDIGVAFTSLYQAIVRYAPDEWAAAQGARALWEMDVAEREMWNATDNVAVSRARELIKSTQWKTERTLRRLYGDDAPKLDSGRINIVLNVGSQHKVAQADNNITIDQQDS